MKLDENINSFDNHIARYSNLSFLAGGLNKVDSKAC